MTELHKGNVNEGVALFEKSAALLREVDDPWSLGFSLTCMSQAYLQANRWEAAQAAGEESLALQRRLGDQTGTAFALNSLGQIARLLNNWVKAVVLYREALALYRSVGEKWGIAWTLHNLAQALQPSGDDQQVKSLLQESLALWRESNGLQGIILCLAGLAGAAYGANQPIAAARLLGATTAGLQAVGTVLPLPDQIAYDRIVDATRTQLDASRFAAAWDEGLAMSLDQATIYALEDALLGEAILGDQNSDHTHQAGRNQQ